MPKATFIASRLEAAMKGWGTDEAVLIRLLAGLDGDDMAELCTTFESKYGRPLAAALKDELSGDFKRAALMWIRALQDPSEGLEALTESDAAAVAEDAEKAGLMLDALLQDCPDPNPSPNRNPDPYSNSTTLTLTPTCYRSTAPSAVPSPPSTPSGWRRRALA